MRSPDLFIMDSRDTEKLSRVEAVAEAVAIQIDELAEAACEALDSYIRSKSITKLADIHGELVSIVCGLASEAGQSIEDAAMSLLARVRSAMQNLLRKGRFSFSNEAIFAQFGKAQERGVISNALYLSEAAAHAEDGLVPDHYVSTSLDSAYSIDDVTVWSDPSVESQGIRMIDLVQIKTSKEKVSDIDRERILRKHKDFLREKRLTIESFRSVDVPEAVLDALIEDLGAERATFISEKWLEAMTDSDLPETVEERFSAALKAFQKDVSEDKAFIKAPRSVKRAFVESLAIEGGDGEDLSEGLGRRTADEFDRWRNAWLGGIKDKKERVLEPVHVPVIRSVIHYRGGEREVETIGKLD